MSAVDLRFPPWTALHGVFLTLAYGGQLIDSSPVYFVSKPIALERLGTLRRFIGLQRFLGQLGHLPFS